MVLAALSLWSNSVCTHTCSPFFEEAPLEVIQYGQKWATNTVVASVKYLWVLATQLDVDLGVGKTGRYSYSSSSSSSRMASIMS